MQICNTGTIARHVKINHEQKSRSGAGHKPLIDADCRWESGVCSICEHIMNAEYNLEPRQTRTRDHFSSWGHFIIVGIGDS